MQCGSGAIPAGAADGGKINDPEAVGRAVKQLLARTEIVETRALVAVNDSLASFRVLHFPATSTDRDVTAAIARELPLDPERMMTRWVDVTAGKEERTVYAVAWDRALVDRVIEAVRWAGVEPGVVELRSASIARAVTQPSCIVLDLSSNVAEIVLIDRHVPQVWHSFPLATSLGEDVAPALATPLRSAIRFYRRRDHGQFGSTSPVLVTAEQVLPAQVLTTLANLVQQPVQLLAAPPRVPPEVRHTVYLACLGLIMRRDA